jgi:hypothetical protein
LLGPEGTAENAKPLGLIRRRNHDFISKVFTGFIEYRPVVFENYTVDASIFVVKLLSAHGGCLGIRSR